jgi:rhodanese-related sulfurtransferase
MSGAGLFGRLMGSVSGPAIDHSEMTKAVAAGNCCIVDVREPHEYAAGHIPGAINHPLSRFEPQALPKDSPVILVCQAGVRSAKALQQALLAGHRDIRHYPPGTAGWKANGGDIVT